MQADAGVRQGGLLDGRYAFADSQRAANYVFPFIDRRWRVPFIVGDLSMGPPWVLEGPIRVDQYRFRPPLGTSDLRRIESVPLDELAKLVHYDPWWMFRRVSGVDRAWIEAVFATNIATPFRHGGITHRVRDLVFSANLDRLRAVGEKPRGVPPRAVPPGGHQPAPIRSSPPAPPGFLRNRAPQT